MATFSGSSQTRPGRAGLFNRYVSASVNLTPDNSWPAIFISHTQSGTTQLRSSAFTLITATKFHHWYAFMNASRNETTTLFPVGPLPDQVKKFPRD